MMYRPLPWLLWTITWGVSWWIGITAIFSVKLNEFYFGELAVTHDDIRRTFISLFLVWVVIVGFQVISLRYYLQRWNWHLVAWYVVVTIGFSAWWTGNILASNETIFRVSFFGGWIVLGVVQLLLLRVIFVGNKRMFFLSWLFATLFVSAMYGIQAIVDFMNFVAIALPGVSLPGIIYGAVTGLLLDRVYKQKNSAEALEA